MHTILELDVRAVRASVAVVSRVTPGDLGRATPCTEWTLADLLAHMTAQHRGFAAASSGRGADPAVWLPDPVGADPVPAYVEAAERVVAAFAQDGVPERQFALPEISTQVTFPGSRAIGFHFVDYVVHTWDVAMATGNPIAFEADLVDAVREIADREVPDGPNRRRTDPSFRPPVPVPDSSSAQDRLLAYLGRSPDWERP